MLTLITMSQGNPIALKRTLDSFRPFFNEVIFGDMCLFEEDRKLIQSYQQEYNMKIVQYPFNHIFIHGFSSILNNLATYASNDLVLYMNVSEIIDPNTKPEIVYTDFHNAFFFTHATEQHHWYRMYNRKEVEWQGLIHEELRPLPGVEGKPYNIPSFQMADTEKDMDDSFKAKVYNDTKELTYFNQYIKLVEQPHLVGITNEGWVEYAKDSYGSLKERLKKKGDRYLAFQQGNFILYMEDIYNNPEFENERQESSTLVNLQGIRKDVL